MRRAAMAALASHWRRHPVQLAMLFLGLALATALWSGVQAINAEARASYARAAAMLGQDRLARVAAADGGAIPLERYIALRRAGWLVSPVVEGELRLGAVRLRLIGLDPLTLPEEARRIEPGEGGLAAFLTGEAPLHVSPDTAKRLAGAAAPPLVTAADLPPDVAITDIGRAQALLNAPGRIDRLIVAPEQPVARPPLETVAPGLVLRPPDPEGGIARLTDSFHLNLTAFGFLSFAVGLFIVYAMIGLAFEQRRTLFRTLRCLGLPLRTLVGLLLAELVLMALAAGTAGVALGYLVASALLPDVAATLKGLYGADVPGTLALRPQWWASGLAIAVAGTLASAAVSLRRVWRMPLLAPAWPRAWALASQAALRGQALAATALFALAAALAQWGSGLAAGFTALGALLLGAALLLPALLAGLLAVLRGRAGAPLRQWFFADARQQLPGLSLALMALLLALAANVGVGTMVSSFRLTFTGWLDQRLAADLYVTARNDGEARAVALWLQPRAAAVLPNPSREAEVAGRPATIYGMADHPVYREHWPLLAALPDAWDRLARGEAALVNEQLARREGLAPGDPLLLPGGWRTVVAGVYSDYGNPAGQVVAGLDAFIARYPDTPRLRFGVVAGPEGAAALGGALRERFGLPAQAVVDQASIKERSLAVFERTFVVTAALGVLTLGVAGLAMFASLTALSGMRLPQIAPLWAMGVPRRRLVSMEFARMLMLAALTLAGALPFGLLTAWMLLAVINVEAFGWRLPMHLFPAEWVRLAALALAAAGLAAAVPALRLLRLSPADLAKVFAHER